jgi:hypothetical protein
VKYGTLFQGKLGQFPGAPVTIKLKTERKAFSWTRVSGAEDP